MSERKQFVLAHEEARRRVAAFAMTAPAHWQVVFRPPTRSLAQNARMWAMLDDVSKQVDWYGKKLTPQAWKCVFSASLKKQDVVPGLHGDFVVIGHATSKMTTQDMSELMELMQAFGAERGVTFSDRMSE